MFNSPIEKPLPVTGHPSDIAAPDGDNYPADASIVPETPNPLSLSAGHLPAMFSAASIVFLMLMLSLGGLLQDYADSPNATKAQTPVPLQTPVRPVAKALPRTDLKLAGEHVILNDQINRLERRIATLQNRMKSVDSNGKTLARRITTLEGAFGTFTASIKPQAKRLPAPGKPRTGAADPVLPSNAVPLDGVAKAPGAAAPAGRMPGIAQPPYTRFAVLLGSSTDRAALNAYWLRLKRRFGTQLSGLKTLVYQVEPDTAAFRLLAGPVETAARAAQICVELKANQVFCEQTVFHARVPVTKPGSNGGRLDVFKKPR
jgi:hypothetical protein